MTAPFALQTFIESAHTASIIPLSSETAYFAMLAFGNYDMAMPFALAVAGATIGQTFNWWLGTVIHTLWLKRKQHPTETQYHKATQFFSRYGIWLLVFCWMPLLNFVPVIAGFLGTRLKIALPLVAAGLAVHYGSPLL